MTETTSWICGVCGYVHQGPEPPDVCPVCGALRSEFEPYKAPAPVAEASTANQWLCLNCSYMHDGSEPPEFCPICGVGPDHFEASDPATAVSAENKVGKLVIVGGGIAGIAAAEASRNASPETEITILSGESHIPYYRINLTRYLAGEIDLEHLHIHPESWYADNAIDLKLSAHGADISLDDKVVKLCEGGSIPYDSLVLAMGSHAFVPPIPGAQLDGVKTLRTIDDATSILSAAKQGAPCVVIGGGILGIETAAALARQGSDVTLIECFEWLMPRQLNRRAGELLEKHITAIGVKLKTNVSTDEVLGGDKAVGIRLNDGNEIQAGLIVLATGVRPNTCLARKAGIVVDKGITVDSNLATSAPDVFAAGDVAEHDGQLYGVWAASQYQGSIAGLNAVGQPTYFGGIPRSNTLKVLGIDLLSIGQFEPDDGSFTVLDDDSNNEFAHFVFRDCRMTGCILIGHAELGTAIKKAIETGHDFSTMLHKAKNGGDVIDHILNEHK